MTAALEFDSVRHDYGSHTAVDDLSVDIAPGEILCLLGPSGCGKTTALRLAAGLERPAAGEIRVAGELVSGPGVFVPPERRGVGLLFQDYALFPHMSVIDNVCFGLTGRPAGERDELARRWLERVGLWNRRDTYPHTLSGGEQQRVALARALAPEPSVLLLDEPFSNLDTTLRTRLRDEVMAALQEIGTAALMVTHDREEALYLGDRVALMQGGRLLQTGSPLDLYHGPVSPAAARFLGDVNVMTGEVHGGQVATALGPVAAPDLADGNPAVVCVRTEGVRTGAVEGAVAVATVITVHRLGRSSQIGLRATGPDGTTVEIMAHVPRMTSLEPGARVGVRVDSELTFVFQAQDPGS